MRWLYSLCFYLLLPLVILRLLWRAKAAPAYARRWSERFGFGACRPTGKPAIWVHAVSVGETLAALPMIRHLQQRYPEYELVVTTTTPTGSDRVKAALGGSVFHVYAPYDLPDCLARFLLRVRPCLAVIMETELWPNTVAACRHRGIPVLVANARLSAKSARGYQRFSALASPMVAGLSGVAAQHQDDGDRFLQLGLPPSALTVTGSIKFDLTISRETEQLASTYRKRWQGSLQPDNNSLQRDNNSLQPENNSLQRDNNNPRPILLAASTHEGEDELLLQAAKQLWQTHSELLLVLVPRHPERFERVVKLAETYAPTQRHSEGEAVLPQTRVLVGDTMGEMMALLGASDLVFMGGTWVETGGHNLIEPAAWGKPIVCGPSLFNFAEVSRLLQEAGALEIVESPQQLAAQVGVLLGDADKAEAMGQAGKAVAEANRGALERLLGLIDSTLPRG